MAAKRDSVAGTLPYFPSMAAGSPFGLAVWSTLDLKPVFAIPNSFAAGSAGVAHCCRPSGLLDCYCYYYETELQQDQPEPPSVVVELG